jgi:hypothetical protein
MYFLRSKFGGSYPAAWLAVFRIVHQTAPYDRLRALAREFDKCQTSDAGTARPNEVSKVKGVLQTQDIGTRIGI